MLAGAGRDVALFRRVGVQRTMRAVMRFALLLGLVGVVRGRRRRRLLSFARRRAGIVRGLFRKIELGFELGHALRQTLDHLRL